MTCFCSFLVTELAFQIIQHYPDLVNSENENGITPLHILASKPNAFHSSSHLKLFDRLIYHSKNNFSSLLPVQGNIIYM